MNSFIFLLCFVAVPSTFGDNPISQNAEELDRSRSAWNFGGHHPIKKAAYWNRPKNVAGPGSFLTNRRLGSGMTPMAPINIRKKPRTPAPVVSTSMRRRQQKPNARQGRPVTKRHAFPLLPSATFPQIPHYNNQHYHHGKPTLSSYRSSRKLRPASDSIKSRFMKEDLWHLDKGESYVVSDEDLERDNLYRNRNHESNEIDEEVVSLKKQFEHDAEKVVNSAKNYENENMSTHPRHVVHHHHHYDWEKTKGKHNAKGLKKKPAGADLQKTFTVPLPRIHNPIPLGCLLAVPVFHPIRPRHHLACLLSIPGTPSLTRRRRRRSADLSKFNIPTPGQSKSIFEQLFGSNSRMTPVITRKHYASNVGNGKTPNVSGNYKVPATIIAPPQFEKDDVLKMLLGSGGVTAEKMGTVVATNNRYVRYGRGLPMNAGSTRQGRRLPWSTGPPAARSYPANIQQIMESSNNNYIPSPTKVSASSHAKNPSLRLTPARPATPSVFAHPPPPQKSYLPVAQPAAPNNQPPSLILNVQINPLLPPPSGASPPLQQQSLSIEQSQQQETQHQPTIDLPTQQQKMEKAEALTKILSVSPSEKLESVKYAEWIPVYVGSLKNKNARHQDNLKGNYNASESKLLYRKVKPTPAVQTMTEYEKESTNEHTDDVTADSDAAASFVTYNDYNDNIVDMTSENNDGFENQPSYETPSNDWLDQDKGQLLKAKSLSFAVKKGYKENLDKLLQEISNRERAAAYSDSSESSSEPESSDIYDNSVYTRRSSSSRTNNNIYRNSGKYYTVKKLPVTLPDPIFIRVPKEKYYVSSGLYNTVKK